MRCAASRRIIRLRKIWGQGRIGPRFLFCIPVGGTDFALPDAVAARNLPEGFELHRLHRPRNADAYHSSVAGGLYWLLARILSLTMGLFECQVEQGLVEYPLEAPAGAAIAPQRG